MQRDLTDSTVLRNMGGALGHSLLAYKSAIQGIKKLQVLLLLLPYLQGKVLACHRVRMFVDI